MIVKLGQYKSESKLIEACKKSDRKAQRALFDLQAPVMLGVCCRYIKDQSTAEELMLQGFMTVFAKLGQYSGNGSFQGWIRKIMVNTCLGWIRKNKEMYKEVDLELVGELPSTERLESLLDTEVLMGLIDELPQGYRTIFNLYAIEGFTHDEIADQLDISTGTSKSQLSRARKLLQQRIAEIDMHDRKTKADYGQ